MRSAGIGYLCWVACLIGCNGIHRMYAGKWITGFLWFFTLGFLYIGQVIDLFLIPRMIRKANAKQSRLLGLDSQQSVASAANDGGAAKERNWVRTIVLVVVIPALLVLIVVLSVAILGPLFAGR